MGLNIEHEKEFCYVLYHFVPRIEKLANDVLFDSEVDPNYSAVVLCSMICSYLFLRKEIEPDYDIHSYQEYLKQVGFTSKEIRKIEKKRLKESEYYVGPQYIPGVGWKNNYKGPQFIPGEAFRSDFESS